MTITKAATRPTLAVLRRSSREIGTTLDEVAIICTPADEV